MIPCTTPEYATVQRPVDLEERIALAEGVLVVEALAGETQPYSLKARAGHLKALNAEK